ncbi:hypothetical protein Bbelb_395350 [Branchiostoma belcheri]|nr:hypothetical protein Bbelb_395350 [Branchiostoma belcheri]
MAHQDTGHGPGFVPGRSGVSSALAGCIDPQFWVQELAWLRGLLPEATRFFDKELPGALLTGAITCRQAAILSDAQSRAGSGDTTASITAVCQCKTATPVQRAEFASDARCFPRLAQVHRRRSPTWHVPPLCLSQAADTERPGVMVPTTGLISSARGRTMTGRRRTRLQPQRNLGSRGNAASHNL